MGRLEREQDNRIRAYAATHDIKLPEGYEDRILAKINQCTSTQKASASNSWQRKIVAAVCSLCILLGAGTGVYAAIDHVQERMHQVSQEEKEQYLYALNSSYASADSFSRELTAEEQSRLEELAEAYENDGVFPEGQLLEIADVSGVAPDRICFLAETSTFYLPESALTDEDMLELIDFYVIREYSLLSGEQTQEYEVSEEIAEETAWKVAAEAVAAVFGADTSNMELEAEYVQGSDGVEDFSTEYVYFSDFESGETYFVTVDMQTGRIGSVARQSGDDVYTEDAVWDLTRYWEYYDEVEKLASAFLSAADWKICKMEFLTTEDGIVKNGVVSYYFIGENGDCCKVNYSCAQDTCYQIWRFTEEGIAAWEAAQEKTCEAEGLTQHIYEME